MPTRAFVCLLSGLLLGAGACTGSDPGTGGGGRGGQSSGGSGGNGGTGGTGGTAGSGGSGGAAGSGGSTGGSGGGTGGAAVDAGADAPTDMPSLDAGADALKDGGGALDAVNGTPDGGPYARTGWTATSMPPFPTGVKAMNQDLKYANALDGNYMTRWSIGDTNSPAQTLGDQFTLDMKQLHVFKKIMFWSGGVGGVGGPDSRDYPGGLDVSVSDDCVTFGATVGSGLEPQPGCTGGATCNRPFEVTLAASATARCVRLTLNKRLQLGGGIWWAISEIFVLP